jgi:dimethylargininase
MTRFDTGLTAITRELNELIGNCELTFLPRVSIDLDLAQLQHEQYQAALESLGCEFVTVPTEPGLADSVFIEDTALVLDELAVMLRPGPRSRRPELDGVESVLRRYRPLASIKPPGTLDGGIEQLRNIVADLGYSVKTVETTKCLHLKSAVSAVAPGTLLINSDWVSRSPFDAYELLDIDYREAHAANALLVGQTVIYPSSFPRTTDRLVDRGIDVVPIDLSELQKAEGAVTCCSLLVGSNGT